MVIKNTVHLCTPLNLRLAAPHVIELYSDHIQPRSFGLGCTTETRFPGPEVVALFTGSVHCENCRALRCQSSQLSRRSARTLDEANREVLVSSGWSSVAWEGGKPGFTNSSGLVGCHQCPPKKKDDIKAFHSRTRVDAYFSEPRTLLCHLERDERRWCLKWGLYLGPIRSLSDPACRSLVRSLGSLGSLGTWNLFASEDLTSSIAQLFAPPRKKNCRLCRLRP